MEKTHFGFEEVGAQDKAAKVAEVFSSVASRYDLMNDLLSGGLHRAWKALTVNRAAIRPGMTVLDVAGGTADLSKEFARRVGPKGQVWLTDINMEMLRVGRDRMIDSGQLQPVAQCDAEKLPFADRTFDRVSVAFGLRNMTDKLAALSEMRRVLKPGGKLLVLEFSKPAAWLEKPYELYSFKFMPLMGKIVTKDEDSYRYLAESIRMHPDQATLRQMMLDAGFHQADYTNMANGIVALHEGLVLE